MGGVKRVSTSASLPAPRAPDVSKAGSKPSPGESALDSGSASSASLASTGGPSIVPPDEEPVKSAARSSKADSSGGGSGDALEASAIGGDGGTVAEAGNDEAEAAADAGCAVAGIALSPDALGGGETALTGAAASASSV